jgi:hypothetical protein
LETIIEKHSMSQFVGSRRISFDSGRSWGAPTPLPKVQTASKMVPGTDLFLAGTLYVEPLSIASDFPDSALPTGEDGRMPVRELGSQ